MRPSLLVSVLIIKSSPNNLMVAIVTVAHLMGNGLESTDIANLRWRTVVMDFGDSESSGANLKLSDPRSTKKSQVAPMQKNAPPANPGDPPFSI